MTRLLIDLNPFPLPFEFIFIVSFYFRIETMVYESHILTKPQNHLI